MKFKSWFSSKRIFKIRGPQSSGICLKPALVSGVRMRLKQQQRWRETNSTVVLLDRTSCSDGYLKHFTSFSLAWEDWTKYTIHIFGKPRVCHCCHHHMQTFDQRNVYSDKSGVHFCSKAEKKVSKWGRRKSQRWGQTHKLRRDPMSVLHLKSQESNISPSVHWVWQSTNMFHSPAFSN